MQTVSSNIIAISYPSSDLDKTLSKLCRPDTETNVDQAIGMG